MVRDIKAMEGGQREKRFRAIIMRIRLSDPENRTDAHSRQFSIKTIHLAAGDACSLNFQ